MVLSKYLLLCFPNLQRRVRRRRTLGSRGALVFAICLFFSPTGSTIAILRCPEEHGGTVGPSTAFLAMQVCFGEDT
jgi:hypothetical protein